MSKNRSNLNSLAKLRNPPDIHNINSWFLDEIEKFNAIEQTILRDIITNISYFVKFPTSAILMWQGCNRETKYHKYPLELATIANKNGVSLKDRRSNGPAIAAFEFAGGERPMRFGSTNSWSIHHIYSGKFPFPGKTHTIHAQKDGNHFTQSAGLIAAHPIADACCDEYPELSWFLRALAYERFGYDPDCVFTPSPKSIFGFDSSIANKVLYTKD